MIKSILMLFIAFIAGLYIDKCAKSYVESDSDCRLEYGLLKRDVLICIEIIAIFIVFKFNFDKGLIYLILSILLLLVAIVDYYTHFVYWKTIFIAAILLIISIGALGMTIHFQTAILAGIISFVLAFFSNKCYGDAAVIVIIALVVGYIGTVLIAFIAVVITLILLFKNRKETKEIAFCPMLLIGYLVFLLIV